MNYYQIASFHINKIYLKTLINSINFFGKKYI